jgi:hypothetical protein
MYKNHLATQVQLSVLEGGSCEQCTVQRHLSDLRCEKTSIYTETLRIEARKRFLTKLAAGYWPAGSQTSNLVPQPPRYHPTMWAAWSYGETIQFIRHSSRKLTRERTCSLDFKTHRAITIWYHRASSLVQKTLSLEQSCKRKRH